MFAVCVILAGAEAYRYVQLQQLNFNEKLLSDQIEMIRRQAHHMLSQAQGNLAHTNVILAEFSDEQGPLGPNRDIYFNGDHITLRLALSKLAEIRKAKQELLSKPFIGNYLQHWLVGPYQPKLQGLDAERILGLPGG